MSGGTIGGIVSGIFGPLFGAINDWITSKRNDANAKELGASREREHNAAAGEAELDVAARAATAARADLARDPSGVRRPDRDTAARDSDGIS